MKERSANRRDFSSYLVEKTALMRLVVINSLYPIILGELSQRRLFIWRGSKHAIYRHHPQYLYYILKVIARTRHEDEAIYNKKTAEMLPYPPFFIQTKALLVF